MDLGRLRMDSRDAIGRSYIDWALVRFSRGHRYIEKAQLDGSTLCGTFRRPTNVYYEGVSPHLNTIEYMLCLNQFAFLLAALIIDRDLCEQVADLTKADFLAMRSTGGLRVCSIRLSIHHEASCDQPIDVSMTLAGSHLRDGVLWLPMQFDIGQWASGELTTAMLVELRNGGS